MIRTPFRDEMWLSLPDGIDPAESGAMDKVQATAMRFLATYLRTQETEQVGIRLRVADIRLIADPSEPGGMTMYHDCDECRQNRTDAEQWLRDHPGSALILVLFEYDEVTEGTLDDPPDV